MVAEPRKLLGTLENGQVHPAEVLISAQCNRVPVLDGHMECVSVRLRTPAEAEAVRTAFLDFKSPIADLHLPSAPERFLQVYEEHAFPQPRRHAELGRGMTVSIGRIRPCPILGVKFIVLVHNTLRGAAGGAVLNAELLVKKGYLQPRTITASTTA